MKALLLTALILFAGAAQAKEDRPCPFRDKHRLHDNTAALPSTAAIGNAQKPGGTR